MGVWLVIVAMVLFVGAATLFTSSLSQDSRTKVSFLTLSVALLFLMSVALFFSGIETGARNVAFDRRFNINELSANRVYEVMASVEDRENNQYLIFLRDDKGRRMSYGFPALPPPKFVVYNGPNGKEYLPYGEPRDSTPVGPSSDSD